MCIRDRAKDWRGSISWRDCENEKPVYDGPMIVLTNKASACLLYTSDAADERSSVDLGGRRIIKKKKKQRTTREVE